MRIMPLAALLLAVPAAAGPPVLDHIDDEATWILHLDLEVAMKTDVGRMIIEGAGALETLEIAGPGNMDWIKEMTTDLGIEIGADVRSICGYGLAEDHEDDSKDETVESMVVLWYGSAKLDKWEGYMIEKAGSEHRTIEHDGRTYEALYTPDLKEWDVALDLGSNERLWVTGWSADAVAVAVDVVKKRRESLDHKTSLIPKGGIPKGTIIFGSASDLQNMTELSSEIAQQADAVWISLGERGDDAFLESIITATSEEDAGSVVDVLQGLVALGRLTLAKDDEIGPGVSKILNGIRFANDGRSVKMNLEYDSASLRALLESMD